MLLIILTTVWGRYYCACFIKEEIEALGDLLRVIQLVRGRGSVPVQCPCTVSVAQTQDTEHILSL
jgi:hypothetical protein